MLPKNLSQHYREQQIITAGPLQRLLMVYDAAIIGCSKHDLKRTTQALNLLRSTLDFEQGEVAVGMYRLYQYCGDLAREGRFDEAQNILRELVRAWVEVLVRETDARKPQARMQQAVCVAG
jgi:flagellin-specific chaperone FliS